MSLLVLIFAVSFLGSIHCSVMCCPVQNLSKNPLRFQMARWLGYFLIWLLVRSLSWALIDRYGTPVFRFISLMLTVWILWEATGLIGWRKSQLRLPVWLKKIKSPSPWLGGLSLSLRGCGWMWSFVALAVAEPDWGWSLGRLAAFFLGTAIPFIASPLLPRSWALSAQSRGKWLLGFAALQILVLFTDPFAGLHDFQTLIFGSSSNRGPNPMFCGKGF